MRMPAAKNIMLPKMKYMHNSWTIFDHHLDGVVDISPCRLMVLVTRGSKEVTGVRPRSKMKLLTSVIAGMKHMSPLKSIYSTFCLVSILKRSLKLSQDAVNLNGSILLWLSCNITVYPIHLSDEIKTRAPKALCVWRDIMLNYTELNLSCCINTPRTRNEQNVSKSAGRAHFHFHPRS